MTPYTFAKTRELCIACGEQVIYIDYFTESVTYMYRFYSQVKNVGKRTSEFSKVLRQVNKNPYKAPSML